MTSFIRRIALESLTSVGENPFTDWRVLVALIVIAPFMKPVTRLVAPCVQRWQRKPEPAARRRAA